MSNYEPDHITNYSSTVPEPHSAALSTIDEALDNWKNQTMCPQAHVVDVLLDIRRLLSNG